MGSFTFNLNNTGATVDQTLYAGTPDDKLVYTGNDSVVWDRINAERLRRGLVSLTSLGYPRPPEETTSVDTAGSSQTFTVKGPASLTREQAYAIFQQQQKAGSLVGLKPGATISAATQAAAGLPGALAQLSGTVASTSKSILSRLSNNSLSVTNGINLADFAKQAPGLKSMGNLNISQVTASLSQASKLVGQTANAISNNLGVGKYGLDGSQLEKAGLIKAGTTSYLSQSTNTLTSVLNSPSVWTGKNGVDSLDKLLNNPSKQDLVQQDLMSSGLAALRSQGIPVDALDPKAISGAALNAAKSIEGALSWAKGLPLPTDVKTAFDQTARDAAYAVNFSDSKISDAMAQSEPGKPAEDTVNRQTLDAAGTRVVGDDKIPPVSYSNAVPAVTSAEIEKQFNEAADTFVAISDSFKTIARKTNQQRADTNSYYDDIAAIERLIGDLEVLDSSMAGLIRRANNLTPPDSALVARIEKAKTFVGKSIKNFEGAIASLRQLLATRTA